ncbi:hypothetical protein LTR65_008618 [Meristemomyces frigidus]
MTNPRNLFDEHDSYWRIDDWSQREQQQRAMEDMTVLRKDLSQYCSKDHSNQSRAELITLLKRSDHRLLCYVHCSVKELKQFIRDRRIDNNITSGLSHVTSGGPLRNGLYTILERADAMPDFHGFLKLPPELRKEIYSYYIAGFQEQVLHAPTMPPLARLNRTIREEVLPMFFEQCTFEMQFTQTARPAMRFSRSSVEPVHVRPETALFFSMMARADLARIRKLRICVKSYEDHTTQRVATPLELYILTCDVVLPKEGNNAIIKCVYKLGDPLPPLMDTNSMLGHAIATNTASEVAQALQRLTSGKDGAVECMGWRGIQALTRAVERAWGVSMRFIV